MPRALVVAIAAGAAFASTACAPLRSHQGYVFDETLVSAVQPGVDNRESVRSVLGTPTVVGQFGNRDWYYLGRDSKNLAFNRPKPVDQTALHIVFDDAGTVRSVTRTDESQIVSISPSGKETPTLGRKESFLSDLFGNIGSVGAGGMQAPTQ